MVDLQRQSPNIAPLTFNPVRAERREAMRDQTAAAWPERDAWNAPRRGVAALVLALGDVLLLEIAVALGVLVRMHLNHWVPIDINPQNFVGVAVAVLFLPVAYATAGLYPGYGQTGVERLRKRVTITTLCFSAMILFDRLAQEGQWSRGILLTAGAIAVVGIPLWDATARRLLIAVGWWGKRVVILGPEQRRRDVAQSLSRHPELGWIPAAGGDFPALGEAPVPGIDLALVVLSDPAVILSALTDELPYRQVVIVPDMSGVQSLWVSVRDLGTEFGLEMQRNLLNPVNQVVKRAIDILFASVGLVLAAPVIALGVTALFIVSPGTVFYTQARSGLQGRAFRMWKLRTMVPHAEHRLERLFAQSEALRTEWESAKKLRDDPRVVPVVGTLMRRFSIDELPQLWNVLRGDMSLVGPRPLPAYHLECLDPLADRMRQKVRPGITGLWQVSGRSAISLPEQQRLDTYYVRNWSLWLDIEILCRTVSVVLSGRGAW